MTSVPPGRRSGNVTFAQIEARVLLDYEKSITEK